jgi:surface polysaccharide O-acyltransferase-like enzyme
MGKNEDLSYLNTLRVLATFAVVWLHVSATTVLQKEGMYKLDWWVGNTADAASRWCIPVFVFVSGALLLDPAKTESAIVFYRKRLRRIMVPLVFWTAVYIGPGVMFSRLTWRNIAISLLQGTPYSHLWYLYMILGLYGLTPALRIYVRASSDRQQWSLAWGLILVAMAYMFFDRFFLVNQRSVFTMFIPYIGYYLLGYQFRCRRFEGVSKGILAGAAVVCMMMTAVGTDWLIKRYGVDKGMFLYNYFSPSVMPMSVAVFLLFYRWHTDGSRIPVVFKSAMERVAPATLGIYLFHPLAILFLERTELSVVAFSAALMIPLISILAFVLSYIVVLVILKIPYLRATVA